MSSFILEAQGPSRFFGVFEDDGKTGYLHIYEPQGAGLVRSLHIYDRNSEVVPEEGDIRITWSDDRSKCGVFVWDSMRGIIDLARNRD